MRAAISSELWGIGQRDNFGEVFRLRQCSSFLLGPGSSRPQLDGELRAQRAGSNLPWNEHVSGRSAPERQPLKTSQANGAVTGTHSVAALWQTLLALVALVSLAYAPAVSAQTCVPYQPVLNSGFNGTASGHAGGGNTPSWTASGSGTDGWTRNTAGNVMLIDNNGGTSTSTSVDTITQNVSGVAPGSTINLTMSWGNGTDTSGLNNGNQARLQLIYGGVVYGEFFTSNFVPGGSYATSPYPTAGATFIALNGATITTTAGNWGNYFTDTNIVITLPASAPLSGALTLSGQKMENANAATDDFYVNDVSVDTTTLCLRKTTEIGTGTFGFTTGAAYDANLDTAGAQSAANITTATANTPVPYDASPTLAGAQPLVVVTPGVSSTIFESTIAATDVLIGVVCDNGVLASFSGLTATIGAIPARADVTCTLTNSKRPIVRLLKEVPSGRFAATDQFQLSISGTGAPAPVTTTGSGTTASGTVLVSPATIGSSYTMSEIGAAGANFANYTTTFSCTNATNGSGTIMPNGSGTAIPAIAPIAGDDISCKFVNTAKASLTLIKRVTNDNGGSATVSAFGLTTSGGALTFGSATGSAPTLSYASTPLILAAGAYTLRENDIAGYAEGTWSCSGTGGTLTNSSIAAGSVTLANGAAVTCEITNNDTPATLTLIKTVTNDNGGTRTITNFPLTATGTTTGSTPSVTGVSGTASVTNASVNAGTYTLSEVTQAGYTASAWSCTGGTLTGTSLVLAGGASASCTINNNDTPATLTLIKTVTNDNGGTRTIADFPLTATGTTTGSTPSVTGVSGTASVTNASVNAGTYTLSEVTQAGYTASAWSCTGGTLTGTSLVLTGGASASCTINNNDTPATLTIAKTIVNDNGGVAMVGNFGITTNAGTLDFATQTGTAPALTYISNPLTVAAGTYSLVELNLPGYAEGTWSCVGATGTVVPAFDNGSVTLANGDNVTCSITNDDISAQLTLIKHVTNDNGGTATVSDFNIATNAGALTFGTATGAFPTLSYKSNTLTVSAGDYSLTEADVAGYAEGNWSCSVAGVSNVVGPFNSGTVRLANGANAICEITNNDQPALLILVKEVINDNGGTATPPDFALNANGTVFTTGVGQMVSAGVYTLAELNLPGYIAGTWSCGAGPGGGGGSSGGGGGDEGGRMAGGTAARSLSGDQLTLENGDSTLCTIINDDMPATLQLVKTVDNTGGGTAVATDWTLSAAGPTAISGAGGVLATPVDAGVYTLSETTGPAAYTAGLWQCSNGVAVAGSQISLAIGQSTVCTIVNTFAASPAITTTKTAALTTDNGALGQADAGDVITYTVTAQNTGNVTLTSVSVIDSFMGGPATALSCTPTTLLPGETATCVSYTHLVTQAEINAGIPLSNVATATGTPPTGTPVTDPDDATVTPVTQAPKIALIKTATTPLLDTNGDGTAGSVGDTIAYTFTVTNTGNVPLTGVTVTDPLVTVVGGPLASLAVGASDSTTFTATYTITAADVVTGSVTNTATATGTPPVGPNVTDTSGTTNENDTPTVTPVTQAPKIALIKTATTPLLDTNGDGTAGSVGDTIAYTFTVTNTGNVPLTGVTVTDPLVTVVGGPLASLAVGASDSTTFTATYTITAADVVTGSVTNTATATGTPPVGPNVTDTSGTTNENDTPTVTPVTQAPALTIVKTAEALVDTNGDGTAGSVGDTINYKFRVENTGNIALANVTVSDALVGVAVTGGPLTTLAPGAVDTTTFHANYVITQSDVNTGSVTNSATVLGTTPNGTSVTSPPSVIETPVVPLPAQLRVTKSAAPHDVRVGDLVRYTVTIENLGVSDAVDATVVDTPPAGFTYVDGTLKVADRDGAGRLAGTYPIRVDQVDVAAGAKAVLTYMLRVGAGVRAGIHTNSAYAQDGSVKSNIATAEVQLVGDPLVEETIILGTVFDDRDGDGWQDPANLSGIKAQGGIAAEAYVPNSTTVDRGAGMQPEADASSPLLHGIVLGKLTARQSDADPVEAHRMVIRQKMTEPRFSDDFVLTTDQGHIYRMNAAGDVRVERSGDAAKDLTGADLRIERKVSQIEGAVVVDYVITNHGVDERGIPGVRVASVEGLISETDQFGRYHMVGIPGGPWERGRNFILKVDPATLPPGAPFTTDNPLLRRITPGIPVRFDFGVKLPPALIEGGKQGIEIELATVIFEPGSARMRPGSEAALDHVAAEMLARDGGEIVISANGESQALAFDRAKAVKTAIDDRNVNGAVVTLRTEVSDPRTNVISLGPVPLLGEVFFDTDKTAIRPEYVSVIASIAADIEEAGGGIIGIVGHADRRASDAYNIDLAMRRSQAVFAAIAERLSPQTRAKLKVEVTRNPAAPLGMGGQ